MGIPFSVHFRESGYKLKELTSFVTNKTDLDEINEKIYLKLRKM